MILNKDLAPGQKVSKKELADALGVSQTPVQEAIIRLIQEGVLEQQDRKGIFVKIFTYKDMRDIFAVRAGIESIAIRICIENFEPSYLEDLFTKFDSFTLPISSAEEIARYQMVDKEFHEQILLRSENSIIKQFIQDFDYIIRCYQKGLIREPSETLPEHKAIITAARERDAEKAQLLLMRHHMSSCERINKEHMYS